MQIKPRQNRLSLSLVRRMMSGEITEPRVVLDHHAAMLLAVPQASLRLNFNIIAACFSQHVLHVGQQGFASRAPIRPGLLIRGKPAGGAKDQRAHDACLVPWGIAKVRCFNVGKALVCQRKRKRHELHPHRLSRLGNA